MNTIFYKLDTLSKQKFLSQLEINGYFCVENQKFIVIIDLNRQMVVVLKYADASDAGGEDDVCTFWTFNCNILNRRRLMAFEQLVENYLLEAGGVEYAEWNSSGNHSQ